MREVIIPQFYRDLARKTAFFEGWSWFKFNKIAQGANLKFYTSMAKGLKLKVRNFGGLIPTFVEVTGEKLIDLALDRDPKNIFFYQRDVENYTDQVLNFLLFDRQICTRGTLRSAILVSILMLRVYLTFSLFFKI